MIATRPFSFESNLRRKNAEKCFEILRDENAHLVVLDNDSLLHEKNKRMSIKQSLDIINARIAEQLNVFCRKQALKM